MNTYIECKLPYDAKKTKFIIDPKIQIKYLDPIIVSYKKNLYNLSNLSNKIQTTNEMLPINSVVIRKVTNVDINKTIQNNLCSERYKRQSIEIIKKMNLKMKVIAVNVSFDKKKMLLIYTADTRIDFRELVKELAKNFKSNIELKQIGVRDRTKLIGGYGICGQKLCCQRYLKKFDTINISLAKNQKVTLNPNKINGMCGRLRCCLKYEEENKK